MGKHYSNKHFSKKQRRKLRGFESAEIIELHHSKFEAERNLPPIKPLNPTQAEYLDALRTSPQVIVLGPAGTGKTWIAATHAADRLRQGFIEKRIHLCAPIFRVQQLRPAHFARDDFVAPWVIKVGLQQLHVFLGLLILFLEKTLPVVLIPHPLGPALVTCHTRLNVTLFSRAKRFARSDVTQVWNLRCYLRKLQSCATIISSLTERRYRICA